MLSLTCLLWAGAEGTHFCVLSYGFSYMLACVESGPPYVTMPGLLLSVLTASFLYFCCRVYQGPKVNEERRLVRPEVWGRGGT